MANLKIDYRSPRSQKARIGVRFSPSVEMILYALTFLLLIAGLILIIFELPVGWAVLGFSIVPAMAIEWYKGELCNLDLASKNNSIDDILSGEILGRLSNKPTPIELATIVSRLYGGYFFALRFGLGAKFLQEIASNNPDDINLVWQEAVQIKESTNSKEISAAVIVVALIKSFSNYESILSRLQLDIGDLYSGVRWHNFLIDLIEQHKKPVRTGGIARDWSFGWTPFLDQFADNISNQVNTHDADMAQLASRKQFVDQIIKIFSKNGRQNVALVGPLGSGKTELLRFFAAKLLDADSKLPSQLKFRQVYVMDAASLIAAASGRGELENLLPQILNEAYRAKNIIICLEDAQMFFEDSVGSVDVSNVLLPILNSGNLRIILTMDEQRYLQISKRNPEIANSLNRISVSPTDDLETMATMQDRAIDIEYQNDVTFMYQALQEAYRLGDRYVYDLVMPGKAIKMLEMAANFADNGLVTAESVQTAIEKSLNVKVSVAQSGAEREKLLNLEELIHDRMINQTRAVKVVSDAIRRARAGVRNQNRPIGTFLFLGPTGVGKTELAKALAAIYFGGEDRIVRIDMNEYVSKNDVSRLIADGADNEYSLTARVIKQPFSVVLLDEIEKAHPDVLSTLLQVLDEGILRDTKNRDVSFRDAIIIATSNAGANRIREYIERGYDVAQFEDKFLDELISSQQFRPEFLNRFDETVVFRPLKKNELLQVVDLILDGVNKTLEKQKITVSVSDEAKRYLVDAGYDPRLGARPMRRVVQRAVESTVAKLVLEGEAESGSAIEVSLEQVKNIIDTKNTADKIVDGIE